jgi:parallel beta-helix repeat protein
MVKIAVLKGRAFGLALLLPLALAALISQAPMADSSRIPVYEATTLSSSGLYYLTRDLIFTGSSGITIAASHVTLDLNGHRLLSTSTSSGSLISANGYTDIKIMNGFVQGGYYGIYLYSPRGSVRVDNVRITGTASPSLAIVGSAGNPVQAFLENNTISGASAYGLYMDYAHGGIIKDNMVTGCTTGMRLEYCNGNLIEGNNASLNSADGINLYYSYDNTVRGNTACKNGGTSLYNGIMIYYGSNNTVDWNLLGENAWYGLYVYYGGSNVYSYNRAPGNTTGNYYSQGSGALVDGGGNY